MESLVELSNENSLLNEYLAEMRDAQLQKDAHRFRENLEAVGKIMAYEVSKSLAYKPQLVATPLAQAKVNLIEDNIVIAGIMRAALPLQNGFLSAFRKADAAFIAAYRKSTSDIEFEIITEYEAKPNLNGKTLIIVDTMCATARSFLACYEKLTQGFEPKKVIFASVFASKTGIETISSKIPQIVHYTCVVDDELNAKSYIVPGLGDAGDLAFGNKI